jgi:Dcp1-like decapping family
MPTTNIESVSNDSIRECEESNKIEYNSMYEDNLTSEYLKDRIPVLVPQNDKARKYNIREKDEKQSRKSPIELDIIALDDEIESLLDENLKYASSTTFTKSNIFEINEHQHYMNKRQVELVNKNLMAKDSEYKSLLAIAARVAVYQFNEEWQECNVDGNLYLYTRHQQPKFRILILNRLSREDFRINLESETKLEYNQNFLIFTVKKLSFGLWFENDKDAKLIYNIASKNI